MTQEERTQIKQTAHAFGKILIGCQRCHEAGITEPTAEIVDDVRNFWPGLSEAEIQVEVERVWRTAKDLFQTTKTNDHE